VKLARLSHEHIGDFAETVSQGPPRIVVALYDEPEQWRQMIHALERDLSLRGVGVVHLECDESAGPPLADRWIEAIRGAGPDARLFVAGELSLFRDDRFGLLFRALEERREVIVSSGRGVLMLSVTPERVAEVARSAPGFYSIADVLLLSEERFRVPDDPAYREDRATLEGALRELEQKHAFPSDQLWERMATGKCRDVPEEDLRRWERLVEAVRKG